MPSLKKILLKAISFAIYPQLDENKKIAIQIASFDAIASLTAFVFYLFYSLVDNSFPLTWCHLTASILCFYGIMLLRWHHYNAGRFLIFFVGLAEIFICIDGVSNSSGFEIYYLSPLLLPFVVFTPEELPKSISLSLCAFAVFLIQQYMGPGLLSNTTEVSNLDKVITISILFTYIVGLLSISRWQMNSAQKKIKSQQSELIHISNIAALGEMSGGIAHEINNPLQILTIQLSYLKKHLNGVPQLPSQVEEHLGKMDSTIQRIARLVKGLRNLSRNVVSDPPNLFPISNAIDDMLAVSAQKLKHMDIELKINGDTGIMVLGHMVQLSQVLINLLNNAVDAIDDVSFEKWIVIDITQEASKILISITDSGPGIPKEVALKIMHPFFTTKSPGKGTGLGLSISRGMIEKIDGRLFLDQSSPNTKFVIELPVPS